MLGTAAWRESALSDKVLQCAAPHTRYAQKVPAAAADTDPHLIVLIWTTRRIVRLILRCQIVVTAR